MSFSISSVCAVDTPTADSIPACASSIRPFSALSAVRCVLVASLLATSVSCAPTGNVGIQAVQTPAAPSLRIRKDIDLVRLQGVFSSADEVAMVYDKAVAAFGAEMIINDLQVDQKMQPAEWLDKVMLTAEKMQDVAGFSLAAGSGNLKVGGSVETKSEADQIAEMASSMAGMELAVSSSLVYPVDVSGGTLAGAEVIDIARAEIEGVLAGDVIPDNVLDQPAVAIQSADFKVIPAVARVRDVAVEKAPVEVADFDGDGVTDDKDECQTRKGYPVNERGCQVLDGYLESVRFYGTTNRLTQGARDSLDELAGIMQQHPVAKIAVISYSKDSGPVTDSRALARMRAFSVVDYLNSAGIEKNRLSAFALGNRKGVRDQIMIKEVD